MPRDEAWLHDYADLVIPSLLTADTEHARWFARETVGSLGQNAATWLPPPFELAGQADSRTT
ncbi:hypothetical protein [Lentzea flaviverrucosa]|uniref:Uncharacterized protein n=1 Tax=Lentzea flaviverrucosa TaxID=200379 RepID=A0A1H9XSC1_9PSEU|nr:hypothetical protein [Lentzea flaviverrucosa]RDI19354.1 hypothetical protein DFR72_117196 [Lentzea flaviverrucosa]SES48949.1 hypothetical protein SAMN05216195_11721 [Lentzea flaviverrucosa]